MAPGEADAQLAFTRMGSAGNDGGAAVPRRLGYRLRGQNIEFLYWPVLDQAARTLPQVGVALAGVAQMTLRYRGADGNWQAAWPTPGSFDAVTGGSIAAQLPAAVEITLRLVSGEEVRRIFALPAPDATPGA